MPRPRLKSRHRTKWWSGLSDLALYLCYYLRSLCAQVSCWPPPPQQSTSKADTNTFLSQAPLRGTGSALPQSNRWDMKTKNNRRSWTAMNHARPQPPYNYSSCPKTTYPTWFLVTLTVSLCNSTIAAWKPDSFLYTNQIINDFSFVEGNLFIYLWYCCCLLQGILWALLRESCRECRRKKDSPHPSAIRLSNILHALLSKYHMVYNLFTPRCTQLV
jgi:hypothetical protein